MTGYCFASIKKRTNGITWQFLWKGWKDSWWYLMCNLISSITKTLLLCIYFRSIFKNIYMEFKYPELKDIHLKLKDELSSTNLSFLCLMSLLRKFTLLKYGKNSVTMWVLKKGICLTILLDFVYNALFTFCVTWHFFFMDYFYF